MGFCALGLALLASECGKSTMPGASPTAADVGPTAAFSETCANLGCEFTDQSTDGDGAIVRWSWAFGDGATASVQHPSHTYAAGGSYTVDLTITDERGASDATAHAVTVERSFSGGWRVIAAGGDHTCGVDTNDRAFCWGEATLLGAGLASNGAVLEPYPVAGAPRFRTVSAARRHTCGLTPDGVAYCWGSNSQGQLGNRDAPDSCDDNYEGPVSCSLTPLRVEDPPTGRVTWRSIAVGSGFAGTDISHFTCAVTTSDELYCWGDNAWRQFDSSASSFAVPTLVGAPVGTAAAGGFHLCVTNTNQPSDLICSGRNRHGQLGLGFTSDPMPPPNWVGQFRSVSTGETHSCAIAAGGTDAYCWGSNTDGKLGRGFASSAEPSPQVVNGTASFAALTAGGGHTCGVTTGQLAYCWGGNSSGQLGNGATTVDELLPFPVRGGLRFQLLDAGDGHTCGVTTGGEAYCWGRNNWGQLGDGSLASASVPQRVADPTR